MGGNGGGGRETGINQGCGSNQGSGGGGGISKVYAFITWTKTPPTTNPPASVNGDSGRPGFLTIVYEINTLNALSFIWSGAGALKT